MIIHIIKWHIKIQSREQQSIKKLKSILNYIAAYKIDFQI